MALPTREWESLEMQHKQHPAESADRPAGTERATPAPRSPGRPRLRFAAQPPGLQVRRILVLVRRFQALCALRSDPQRLAELLRTVIACCRETFDAGTGRRAPGRAKGGPSEEQARCVKELEVLLQGLKGGSPEASSGLAHAMDALLIQCVVFDAGTTAERSGRALAID